MKKKIVIESCSHCHLKECWGGSDEPCKYRCKNKLTYGLNIDDIDLIPSWCMLDDDTEDDV